MNAKLDKTVTMQRAQALPRLQYGALCYRFDGDTPLVLLITSRGTGRWILPKGWPVPGCTAAQSAAMEAWEEAGVRGQVLDHCLGRYSYPKWRPGLPPLPLGVAVYPLKVSGLAADFPERGQRRRKWLMPASAAELVQEPGLARILAPARQSWCKSPAWPEFSWNSIPPGCRTAAPLDLAAAAHLI